MGTCRKIGKQTYIKLDSDSVYRLEVIVWPRF